MITKTAIVAAFASLAVSAPALVHRSDSGSFTLLTIDSGSSIQYATINANNFNFWIGKPPSASCPAEVGSDCPPGNVTALSVYTTADGGASTDTEVPGGQYVYAAADGALAYTIPHSGVIPANATSGPFVYNAASDGAVVGSFQLGGNNFFACPTCDEDIYQIYADVPGFAGVDCLGIAIATVAYEGVAAWEY